MALLEGDCSVRASRRSPRREVLQVRQILLDGMFETPGFYCEAWVQRDPSFADLPADPDSPAHFAQVGGPEGRGAAAAAGTAPAE